MEDLSSHQLHLLIEQLWGEKEVGDQNFSIFGICFLTFDVNSAEHHSECFRHRLRESVRRHPCV